MEFPQWLDVDYEVSRLDDSVFALGSRMPGIAISCDEHIPG